MNKQKKVLILGASELQVPALQKAKDLGYYVGAVDQDPGAAGVAYADEFFQISTNDPEGVYQAAKRFGADGITTVATDMPMRSIAYACSRLGLTGLSEDTAVMATDKGAMIRAFEAHGVPHPWYCVVEPEEDLNAVGGRIGYPCICKPTDNSASRGVVLVHSVDELEDAVRYSSSQGRSGNVMVEEYMTGWEVSVEAFAVRGAITILAVTDKLTTGAPHFVEMGHSQPCGLEVHAVREIERAAVQAMEAVGIENGPAHVEIMYTDQGPKMIELGARMGGDFITTDLVPLSTGIDMLQAVIRNACGEPVEIQPKRKQGSAIRFIPGKPGTLVKAEGLQEAAGSPGIKRSAMTKSMGERIGEISNSTDRIGYVIAEGSTAREAARHCSEALKKIRITIESD